MQSGLHHLEGAARASQRRYNELKEEVDTYQRFYEGEINLVKGRLDLMSTQIESTRDTMRDLEADIDRINHTLMKIDLAQP